MKPKERVRVAFNHQEGDRVPVAALTVDSPVASEILGREVWTGFSAHQLHRRFEMWKQEKLREFLYHKAEAEIELCREMKLDAYFDAAEKIFQKNSSPPKKINNETWKFVDAEKQHWRVIKTDLQSGFRGEIDSSIKKEGLEKFEKYVNNLEQDSFDSSNLSFEIFNYVLEEIGDEIAVFGSADVTVPVGSSWFPVFLRAMKKRPDLVEEYLDIQLERTLSLLETQLKKGVFGVWGGVDLAGTNGVLFSPEDFEKFVVPRLRKIVNLCHEYGVPYVKHTDGNIGMIFDDLLIKTEVDGYNAIEPKAGMDIFQLKKNYGDQLTLLGNVDCSETLVKGDKEEIEREVKELIERVSPGGGHVVMSSNSIHSNVPAENWIKMIETAKKFGQYPIDAS
ncbi:hypothetical protein AKJ41_05985 [candidate division MSBL1 archaeon SCGC-AAA259O05]|uniref:Uroporphyrinogen decarboxylase (URO-D) domain-containing protein n=1 Tax=candidate division MSBL1 archaeon SCGC-AAA259O05 TaxID=1698271 RepID=A0A133UY04_9EURY|nr:hypothetical protein AKJ41_05985 [candidate division MSBL1 archaeon SCGC-AAA259O05]